MALPRVITCQECGHHEITRARNTIRCHVCRLDQNLTFVQDRTAKCFRCGTRFCPIARDDRLCANCVPVPANAQIIHCVFCHEDRPSVAQDMAVCVACARDKTNRRKLLDAIVRKVERRKETDPGPPPELPAPEGVAV